MDICNRFDFRLLYYINALNIKTDFDTKINKAFYCGLFLLVSPLFEYFNTRYCSVGSDTCFFPVAQFINYGHFQRNIVKLEHNTVLQKKNWKPLLKRYDMILCDCVCATKWNMKQRFIAIHM